VEGVFELTDQLRAQLGERLSPRPRNSSSPAESQRTDGLVPISTGAPPQPRPARGGRDRARLLRPARAPQADARRRAAVDPRRSCGAKHTAALHGYTQALAETRRLEERLRTLGELAGRRERELDLLEFELAEIDSLAPDEASTSSCSAPAAASQRGRPSRAAGAAAEALAPETSDSPGVAALAAAAVAQIGAVEGVDPALDELGERARALAIESADLAAELRAYWESAGTSGPVIERGPLAGGQVTLDALEERLAGLERVARKHGGTIRDVLHYADEARARHRELADADVALEQGAQELERAREDLGRRVLTLRRARRAAAEKLTPVVSGSSLRSRWPTRVLRSSCRRPSPEREARTASSSSSHRTPACPQARFARSPRR